MTTKKIPQSLKECYSEDRLSRDLKHWSETLSKWGKGIFVFLLIVGLISTIAEGIGASQMEYYGGSVWTTVITSIIRWVIYAVIEFFVYQALSLLMAALASIVENTRIAADVAIYEQAKAEGLLAAPAAKPGSAPAAKPGSAPASKAFPGGWICKKCGRAMPAYTGTCACGNTKYNN